MKKILLSITVCLSLLVVFCGSKQPNTTKQVFSDSFAALNPTDFVTNNVLKSAVYHGDFVAIATIPSDNTFVTKSGVASLVCIDGSNSYYNALPYGTSFVTKQSLTASGTAQLHTGTIYYVGSDGPGYVWGWTSSANACTHSGSSTYTFYYNGTFGNGTTLYADVCGITPMNYGTGGAGTGNYFYKDGQWFNLSGSAVVSNLTNCSGGLTDVYVHIDSYGTGSTTSTAVISSYSNSGNTTTINTDTNVTITLQFEDNYGDTWTVSGVISSGYHTVSISSGTAPGGGTVTGCTIIGISPSASSTQNYIAN